MSIPLLHTCMKDLFPIYLQCFCFYGLFALLQHRNTVDLCTDSWCIHLVVILNKLYINLLSFYMLWQYSPTCQFSLVFVVLNPSCMSIFVLVHWKQFKTEVQFHVCTFVNNKSDSDFVYPSALSPFFSLFILHTVSPRSLKTCHFAVCLSVSASTFSSFSRLHHLTPPTSLLQVVKWILLSQSHQGKGRKRKRMEPKVNYKEVGGTPLY